MTGKRLLLLLFFLIVFAAGEGHCWKWFSAEVPDSGLKGNSFIDIVYNDGVIWMATGKGLSYTTDFGETWYTHNIGTGMASDEPSAVFGRPGQIWAACSYSVLYGGVSYPFGAGINFSTDNGLNWTLYEPDEASAYAKLVYDLTGYGISTYAACFYGGFIVSHNNGATWSHVYYSPADSSDYVADNWADLESGRYYACAVDSLHADSLFLYGGTARGINKFIFVPRRVKMGGNNVSSIAGSEEYYYIGHENGISQADTAMGKFYTCSYNHGLPINGYARKLVYFGGRILAGMADKSNDNGRGIYVLEDANQQWTGLDSVLTGEALSIWTHLMTEPFEGADGGVYDFKALNDSVLFVAAGDSGIYMTLDSGQTWERFYTDSSDMAQTTLTNQILSVDATSDTLYLGTKGGLIKASYVPPFTIDSTIYLQFAEDDSTGSMVTCVRHHEGDTVFTWVAVAPHPDSGGIGNYSTIQIIDADTNLIWAVYSITPQTITNDIIITDSATTFATSTGLRGNYNLNQPIVTNFVYSPKDDTTGLTIVNSEFQSLALVDGHLFAGSNGGWGRRRTDSDWSIVRANTNSLTHDLAVAKTAVSSGLPGNWVTAIAVQDRAADTLLWAACRAVSDTVTQYTGVGYSSDFGDSWTVALQNEFVWNFAFDNDGGIYAAASGGLFYSTGDPDVWQRAEIIDFVTKDTIWEETEVYSVEVVDSILWVGTSFGLAYRPLNDVDGWTISRVFKPTESDEDVFAAPVPFSPLLTDGRLTIHYPVVESAEITITIYDFAMNLVATVAENRSRPAGEDYFETWDGYNEDGDMVATGVYYFKVSYSTGEEHWGKLAIIP
ncbi:MAG: FlgD immunoglobulin-like domain containing protein [Candidatus Zixiibacteriota bacterium]